jgi:hypothetical protein
MKSMTSTVSSLSRLIGKLPPRRDAATRNDGAGVDQIRKGISNGLPLSARITENGWWMHPSLACYAEAGRKSAFSQDHQQIFLTQTAQLTCTAQD